MHMFIQVKMGKIMDYKHENRPGKLYICDIFLVEKL